MRQQDKRKFACFNTIDNKLIKISIREIKRRTGDGHGEALAELCDFSFSSGNSTEFILMFLALRSKRRL